MSENAPRCSVCHSKKVKDKNDVWYCPCCQQPTIRETRQPSGAIDE